MEFFNPNVAGQMAQLLIKNQENYVPCCGEGDSKKVLTPIPFHGDQLFEERARNVIGTFRDGDNGFDRLEGIQPEFADWHAKVNLYEVYVCIQFALKFQASNDRVRHLTWRVKSCLEKNTKIFFFSVVKLLA